MDIIVAQGSEAGGHRGSFLNHGDDEPMIEQCRLYLKW